VLDYLHVILWFIFIEILGLLSMPLAGMLGNRLVDKGYSAARTLGIVLITYISWILSYLLGFNRYTILISVFILSLISLYLYRRKKEFPEKRVILSNELVFAVAFIFFLIVRIYLPEIYNHEKYMDFAFLNAAIRTSAFPPLDPWYAGGTLDFYYYFGYLSTGVFGKLFSVEPSILFNLTVALTFALTVNLLFGLGYNLIAGKVKYGIITAATGALLGNLGGLIEFVSRYIQHEPSYYGYYWSSSRVIPYTINEFPYFSFIHGDLHSHMLAIPFQLLLLVFLLNIYFRRDEKWVFENLLAFLIFSISLGFLFPCNSWDFPVYFGLAFFAILSFYYGQYQRKQDLFSSGTGFSGTFALISIFSILLYLPFYLSFKPHAVGGIDFLGSEFRTEIDRFLILFSLFLFLNFSFLISRLESWRKIGYFALLIGISALFSRAFTIPLLVILFPMLAFSLFLFLKDLPKRSSVGFSSLLTAAAAFMALLCELVYLNDHIYGAYLRMNTVFKFYMHLWAFLAISASYSYYELRCHFSKVQENSPLLKWKYMKKIWALSLLLLVVSCSIFPVVATYTRIKDMDAMPSLDGMEYMKDLDRGDYNAIKWIQENITGTPGILEAASDQSGYTYFSRVSTNTGLPTIIGWTRHERFWGRDNADIQVRLEDVRSIYSTRSIEKTRELMDKYNISYVYIGQLERQTYNVRIDKFQNENYFEPVYQGSVQIYKIKREI
jgi:YYY domain-containing protein